MFIVRVLKLIDSRFQDFFLVFLSAQYRTNLFSAWCHHLTQAGIQYRSDIALTEYLSNPDERLRWQANALPSDDLCTENAIMLKVAYNVVHKICCRVF